MADALSKIASSTPGGPTRIITLQTEEERSTDRSEAFIPDLRADREQKISIFYVESVIVLNKKKEVVMNTGFQPPDWREPIKNYILRQELPEDRRAAQKIIRSSAHYLMEDSRLYRRSFTTPLLKCLGPEEARYVLAEIHE